MRAFIGVQGAAVISGCARNKKDIGKATLIGFLIALVVYILLSILPFKGNASSSIIASS